MKSGEIEVSTKNVYFEKEMLCVVLYDDRIICVPVEVFPRLKNATSEQRNNWEFLGPKTGIHWPEVDEDILVESLIYPQLRVPPKLANAESFSLRISPEKPKRREKKKTRIEHP